MMRKVLIVVPAFNEAGSLGRVLGELQAAAAGCDVLVVDDGSTDGTVNVIDDRAILLSLPFNLGIGGAMQCGFRYAVKHEYDIVVQVDADGQHPAGEVSRLVEHLERTASDLVIGSRYLDGVRYRQTLARKVAAGFLRRLLALLSGHEFTDCTSGFRAVGRKLIRAFAYWYPDDFPEPESLLHVCRYDCRIAEVAVSMRSRFSGASSVGGWRGPMYVAKVTFALLLARWRRPWPVALDQGASVGGRRLRLPGGPE